MKKVNLYIMALTAVCTLFTACQDEDIVQPEVTPAAVGDEIIFGGRAGFENSNPGSRTVYSNEVYTYNGVDYERIDWIEGDKIEIYSPQAVNGPTSHYEITGLKSDDESEKDGTNKGEDYAVLTRIGDSSLQWGEGYIKEDKSGYHDFYAMYPSSMMFTDDPTKTVETGVYMDGTTVTGVVPVAQNPIGYEGTDNVVAKPNMNYAYMVAKSTANRENGAVGLSFVPIVTAVEVQLVLPENYTADGVSTASKAVNIAEIQVTGTGIAGSFTADLSTWTETYPKCMNATGATNTIQVSVWDGTTPRVINPGGSFTFTVFLLPGADVADLEVSISDGSAGYVSKALTGITVKKNLKNIYTNLYLPTAGIEINASQWMEQLAGTRTMAELSLPGTGGSFTASYSGDNPDWYVQQSLAFEQQWNLGIRVFELSSNRSGNVITGNKTLTSANVTCNGESVGTTVGTVLSNLLTKVKSIVDEEGNPTETAALILTYQPSGSLARNVDAYTKCLDLMLDENTYDKNRLIRYSPSLTLAEARGKVMIIVRPTQTDEDETSAWTSATTNLSAYTDKILLVNGCGTGKDRWGARGYKINGIKAYDIMHVDDADRSVDYYIENGNSYTSNVEKPVAANGDLAFVFETNAGYSCWYQEWARVVSLEHLGVTSGGYWEKTVNGILSSTTYHWYESYDEKLAAAEKTFEMALVKQGGYAYINSLCGYLVDSSIERSYDTYSGNTGDYGGLGGNIKALANKINLAFYHYLLDSGFDQKTGPTGIVMMDYVSDNSADGGSYYLPGVIVANNFKYTPTTNTSGSGSGTGTGGSTGGI